MKGFLITYKPKDNNAKVLLHHTLYGRLLHKNYMGRKVSYYYPGLLDDIVYSKHSRGKVFVTEIRDNFEEILTIFGEVKIVTYDVDDEIEEFQTGRELWERKANKLDRVFKYVRNKK